MSDSPFTQNDLSFDRAKRLQAERDHAAADQAHRDDLARDVVRLWVAADKHDSRNLTAALDRLAAAYGEENP